MSVVSRVMLMLIAAPLLGCSTTPNNLKAGTDAHVTRYTDNYQEIFRRVSTESRLCHGGNMGAYSSIELDAQLYPDLGMGEVSNSLVNYGVRNYYWTAKIERDGTGAVMTVNSGNTLDAEGARARLERWAAGGSGCFP